MLLSAYIQINSTKLIRWQRKHAVGVTSENKYQLTHIYIYIYFFILCKSVFVSVCSWWGPVLTCSVWCPSWSLSLFPLWSSFSQSSSSSSQRCCPPPLRQRRKRHVHTTQLCSCLNNLTYDYVTWLTWLWVLCSRTRDSRGNITTPNRKCKWLYFQ